MFFPILQESRGSSKKAAYEVVLGESGSLALNIGPELRLGSGDMLLCVLCNGMATDERIRLCLLQKNWSTYSFRLC